VPITLFAVQLMFNVGWSGLFFGLHRPGLAFAEIVLLWCLILATLVAFWRGVPLYLRAGKRLARRPSSGAISKGKQGCKGPGDDTQDRALARLSPLRTT